jgi:hypothetical protein
MISSSLLAFVIVYVHHFIAIKNKSKNPKQSEQVFNITKFVNNYKETQIVAMILGLNRYLQF